MMPDLYSEDQYYAKEDWRQEVMNGDTLLGYWDWVDDRSEINADEPIVCEHGFEQGACGTCAYFERADYEYERSMDR